MKLLGYISGFGWHSAVLHGICFLRLFAYLLGFVIDFELSLRG